MHNGDDPASAEANGQANNGRVADFHQRLDRIETLVQDIERSADPAVRAAAQKMVRALLDLHGAGLATILRLLSEAGSSGRATLNAAVEDDLVASLLVLHDLHPRDLKTRVCRAIDQLQPFASSQSGEFELLNLAEDEKTVRLRWKHIGGRRSSSAGTIRRAVEQAIREAAPEVAAVEVEGLVEPSKASAQTPEAAGVVPLGLPGGRQVESAAGH